MKAFLNEPSFQAQGRSVTKDRRKLDLIRITQDNQVPDEPPQDSCRPVE